jgi:hypothetical protein
LFIQSDTTRIQIIPPAPFNELFAEEAEDYRYRWQLEINWLEWREWALSRSCQADSEGQLPH